MAALRKLGNLAQVLLQSHLRNREDERQARLQSELVRQRQIELAEHNDKLRRAQAEDTRNQALLTAGLESPEKFAMMARAGVDMGDIDPSQFATPERAIMGSLQSRLGTAKREDLPTDIGIEGMLASEKDNPWDFQNNLSRDPRAVKELMTGRDSRRASIEDLVAQETAEGAAAKQADAYGTAMGTEMADSQNFDAVLARKKREYAAMTPLEADRARQTSAARVAAEWDPKVVAQKLDFEQKKNVMELAQIGAKEEAQAAASRSHAVKGLLPTYTRYRELALNVVNSPAGASSPVAGAGHKALAAIPYVGGFLSTTAEGVHAGAEYLRSPETAKNIAELNRLTDTLAQGMANAVLGNKGQTTENDRMTAKNILVNSFMDKDTAADMIQITDRMFQLLPEVSLANQSIPAGQIIQMAYDQAKSEVVGGGPTGGATSPDPSVNPALAAAQERLRQQRARGGR